MVPRTDRELARSLPEEATYWTPGSEDLALDEEFGYFRDTWPIFDIPLEDAKALMQAETKLLRLVDSLADDFLEFDQLARAIEYGDPECIPDRLRSEPFLSRIAPYLADGGMSLDGLELGVAGLVYALASVGCFPTASCRSHPDPWSWADTPVVLFAADRRHATALAQIVRLSGCGFETDPARPELLALCAASVTDLSRLARRVLDQRDLFVRTILAHSSKYRADRHLALPALWPED